MDGTEFAEIQHFGMNTVMTHRAFGKQAGEALKAVREEAARLEGQLSRFVLESEISKINRSAGNQSERLGNDAYEVLARAIEFSRCSRGLFDITIGPLAALWRECKEKREPPRDATIRQVLPLVDYAGLSLDPGRKTAMLQRPGQSVDLGGIGKGFAGDKFLEVFRRYGITSAFTNLGGNVVALGTKPDGSPWRVGIRHPRLENSLIGLVAVADKAVVTSGDYQRCFMDGRGKRYHHILDPATGYPAESGLVSVTVVAENSMDADALSTMLFIAGKEKGPGILEQFEQAEAVVVDDDLKVFVTAGLWDCFQPAHGMDIEILN